uniref:Lipocalin n=1 Tax=Rhipicephalus appendiculatus TaxID=34631 RepID=A0A131Z3D8_RHIAP
MARLLKIVVVGLVVIAAGTWCECDGAVQASATNVAKAQSENKFYQFFERSPEIWLTRGNTTDDCWVYRTYHLTEAEVKLNISTRREGPKCNTLYISYNFGANDTMFGINTAFNDAQFLSMVYAHENCRVVKQVSWSQERNNEDRNCKKKGSTECALPNCEPTHGEQLDPFQNTRCCYRNESEQIKSRFISLANEPFYCSYPPRYTIYVGSTEKTKKPSVPSQCYETYVNLTRHKQG